MDYVVGSVAALISGNVTPNRPKLVRRALTPTKHQPSPNVTPKSEFVEDRSIFLSPTLQKKKAIVKKSPKRIFQNPDLDVTENEAITSPKAEKVKKHLKEDLEADDMGKKSKKSLNNSQDSSFDDNSLLKKGKNIDKSQDENVSPKKKKKRNSECDIDKEDTEQNVESETSPKKIENKHNVTDTEQTDDIVTKPKQSKKNKTKNEENTDVENIQTPDESQNQNEKIKKKKKNKNQEPVIDNTENKSNKNKNEENTDVENIHAPDISENQDQKIKKKKKNKNQKTVIDDIENKSNKEKKNKKSKSIEVEVDEVTDTPNPNAITEKDSDSEHDSDNEIESSDDEETNKQLLQTENADKSSDEEEEEKQVPEKKKKLNKEVNEKEIDIEDEIKRTIFVGNVPLSKKTRKEIKKIFKKYGDIQTVRIRFVPVKDARVTPKMAVIKNELHPERSTVNVYVKFADAASVDKALAENNTVLNGHHLRVSRSGSTGSEHDPRLAVFVGNLPFGIEDDQLRSVFEKCGEIHSVRIVRDKKTNAGKGFGYVNFASKDGVELALNLSEEDITIKNRILRVKRCTQTLGPGQRGQGQRQRGQQGQRQAQQGQRQGQGGQRQAQQGQRQGQQGQRQGQQWQRQGQQGQGQRGQSQGQWSQRPGAVQGYKGKGDNGEEGAQRRIMNKRKFQETSDGPPNKKQNTINQPNKEKKQRKEFVGVTAEKKKKQKFNKGLKKKKVLSEILTKKKV